MVERKSNWERLFKRSLHRVLYKYDRKRKNDGSLADTVRELAALRTVHTDLLSRTAALVNVQQTTINVNLEDRTSDNDDDYRNAHGGGDDDDDDDDVRRRVLRSASWDELIESVREKARSAIVSTERKSLVALANTLPAVYLGDDGSGRGLDESTALLASFLSDANDELLLQPYFVQYNAGRTSLKKAGRTLNDAKIKLAMITQGKTLKPVITIQPSQWFQDFVAVYARADKPPVDRYPTYRSMENTVYLNRDLKVVRVHRNTIPTTEHVSVKHYAHDMGYHLVNFASLFTNVSFKPINKITMREETFTDVEILIHFALSSYENGLYYTQFLKEPETFLYGDKSDHLAAAMRNSCTMLMLEFRAGGYSFRVKNKHIELIRETRRVIATGDEGVESGVREEQSQNKAPVPHKAMSVLALSILANTFVDSRRRNISVFRRTTPGTSSSEKSAQIDSPLGKMLNFDEAAVGDFADMYKNVPESHRNAFNAQLNERTPLLGCVQRMYLLLIGAAACAYALRDTTNQTPAVNVLLAHCVRFDKDRKMMLYSSTTTSFPGILFYTTLGLSTARISTEESTVKLLKITHTASNVTDWHSKWPGMTGEVFLAQNAYRLPFFELFGVYVDTHLRTMESAGGKLTDKLVLDSGERNEGVRFLDKGVREDMRINYGARYLDPARTGYVSMLSKATGPQGYFYDEETFCYFTDGPKKVFVPLTALSTDRRRINFFTLPLLFYYRGDVVDTTPDQMTAAKKSELGGLLNTISERLAGNNNNNEYTAN